MASRSAVLYSVVAGGFAALFLLWQEWRRRRTIEMTLPSLQPSAGAAISDTAASGGTAGDEVLAKGHLKFGNVCARSGKPLKALEHYHTALVLRPAYASAHHNAGGVCQRLKRFEEAVVHYEAALAIKPALVESASNLAVALLNCKRPEAALEWCRKAITMQSDAGDGLNSEAFHHLNVALRLLGRRIDAVEESWLQIAALEGGDFTRPEPVLLAALGSAAPQPLTVVCVKWGSKCGALLMLDLGLADPGLADPGLGGRPPPLETIRPEAHDPRPTRADPRGRYSAQYVNKLLNGIRRHESCSAPIVSRFVCLTEDPAGLDPGVDVLPLAADGREGWWHKARLFDPSVGLAGRLVGRITGAGSIGWAASIQPPDGSPLAAP